MAENYLEQIKFTLIIDKNKISDFIEEFRKRAKEYGTNIMYKETSKIFILSIKKKSYTITVSGMRKSVNKTIHALKELAENEKCDLVIEGMPSIIPYKKKGGVEIIPKEDPEEKEPEKPKEKLLLATVLCIDTKKEELIILGRKFKKFVEVVYLTYDPSKAKLAIKNGKVKPDIVTIGGMRGSCFTLHRILSKNDPLTRFVVVTENQSIFKECKKAGIEVYRFSKLVEEKKFKEVFNF